MGVSAGGACSGNVWPTGPRGLGEFHDSVDLGWHPILNIVDLVKQTAQRRDRSFSIVSEIAYRHRHMLVEYEQAVHQRLELFVDGEAQARDASERTLELRNGFMGFALV